MDGRQDWDFVTMGDYRADMAESAATAVAAIEFVKGRERSALHRVACLELALADALRQLGPDARAKVYSGAIARLPDLQPSALLIEFSDTTAVGSCASADPFHQIERM